MPLIRRSILGAAAALAMALCGSGPAAAADPSEIRLDWAPTIP